MKYTMRAYYDDIDTRFVVEAPNSTQALINALRYCDLTGFDNVKCIKLVDEPAK